MIRRPPRSTLFPTRRSSDLIPCYVESRIKRLYSIYIKQKKQRIRSEEHTSELQSPCNLVCRLLLEKKKKKIKHTILEYIDDILMHFSTCHHQYAASVATVHL